MFFPRFRITNQTLKNVSRIEAMTEVVEMTPLMAVWEMKLREDALLNQIHFSLIPEGNVLTTMQTEKVLKEEPLRNDVASEIGKQLGILNKQKDIQEVMNYRNAFKIVEQWIVMQQKRGGSFIFSKEQLLQIQVLMMEKLVTLVEIGKWRDTQVQSKRMGDFSFKPANAVEVIYHVEDLFAWLNTKESKVLHPVLKAAIVEYELTRIQPFEFGSDRVIKLMSFLVLAVEDVNRKRFFSLEEARSKELVEFYKVISEAESQGDLTWWIEKWSGVLRQEVEKVGEKVKRLAVDTQVRSKVGQQIALNERQIKLLESMERKEWLTMTEIREISQEVSDDTILRDLKDLTKKGLVKKKGKTKGAKYGLKSLTK